MLNEYWRENQLNLKMDYITTIAWGVDGQSRIRFRRKYIRRWSCQYSGLRDELKNDYITAKAQ